MARKNHIQSKPPRLRLVANNGRVVKQRQASKSKVPESHNGVPLTAFLEAFRTKIPDEMCALAIRYATGNIMEMRVSILTADGEVKSHHICSAQ